MNNYEVETFFAKSSFLDSWFWNTGRHIYSCLKKSTNNSRVIIAAHVPVSARIWIYHHRFFVQKGLKSLKEFDDVASCQAVTSVQGFYS